MDRNKELFKNTIILGIGQFIPKIFMLITLPILTKFLSVDDYGYYELTLTISTVLMPLITLQVHQAVFRELIPNRDTEANGIVSSSFYYLLVSNIAFIIITSIVLLFMNFPIKLCIMLSSLLLFESFYMLFGQIVRGLGKNILYSLAAIIYSLTNTLTLLIFVNIKAINYLDATLSIILSYFTAMLFLMIGINKNVKIRFSNFSLLTIKRLLRFSMPIVPSTLSLWIVNFSDRLIIMNFLGPTLSGIFSASTKIPNIYSAAFGIFNLAWTETASKVIDKENPNRYYSYLFSKLFHFLTGLILFFIALSPILFKIFIDDKFSQGLTQVPILFIGVYFNSFVSFYGGVYVALKDTRYVAFSSILGAILNVIINITFIKYIGLYSASISTAVSFFIIVLIRAYDINKKITISYNVKDVILGVICILVNCLLSYVKTKVSVVIVFLIAIIYNFVFNKELLAVLLRKIKFKSN